MKKRIFKLVVLAMVFALSFSAVMAQESPYTLRIVRDWGYGNGTDINGRITARRIPVRQGDNGEFAPQEGDVTGFHSGTHRHSKVLAFFLDKIVSHCSFSS